MALKLTLGETGFQKGLSSGRATGLLTSNEIGLEEDVKMDKKIIIFTSNTCGYCHMAKDYLNENGIEYEEKNISENPDARKELMNQGFMGVPVIYVDDEVIQGFDQAKLEALLK